MPNYCENHTNISGPIEDVRAILDAMRGEDGETLISNLIPMPADIADGWYSWARDNWGTKWGDFDHFSDDGFEIDEYDQDQAQTWCSYMTAWCSFDERFWLRVSRMFPTLTFTTTFQEEGMGFVGAVAVRNGFGGKAYTEDLPSYPEPEQEGEWDVQDYCDALCDLRERMLDEAETALMEVTA